MDVSKAIIYYSDCTVREPIYSTVQSILGDIGLPIISCTLKECSLGHNIVVIGQRGYPTMMRQIVAALEYSDADYVFFCENDVLLHKSHFEFTPERDDTFYYNLNVWRWKFGAKTAITYDGMKNLSCMCSSRKLALEHFRRRLAVVSAKPEEFQTREPRLPRRWGYEPGTKKRRRGGFSDEDYDVWRSEFPNIDIRHNRTYSPPKITLDSFKHKPTGWIERPVSQIEGWNLEELFEWSMVSLHKRCD